jgi:hypothetical protein
VEAAPIQGIGNWRQIPKRTRYKNKTAFQLSPEG